MIKTNMCNDYDYISEQKHDGKLCDKNSMLHIYHI